MYIAFRDDDTSFFSKPEEIREAYDFLNEDEPVSLSIVPYTVTRHKDDIFPYGEGIEEGYYDIACNKELVEFLKENIEKGKIDILLHGYSHEYSKVNGTWTSEMKWKKYPRIKEELKNGKEHLETLLNGKISVFVAPNNDIDKDAIKVLEELKMDYSGIIMLNDRKINLRYAKNFLKR